MVITDRIYGKIKIEDPLILKIVKTPSFQRLKKISQFGPPDEFYHLKNFYRYEHSIGVMILLKKLGASYEEQIAGLLHDISHTAFSHVIDWVIGDSKNESFQDRQHKLFLEKSEIAKLLKANGIDIDQISDYKQFGLLERDIPDLCADRIDYSLREFPISVARACFRDLTVIDNRIVFKNQKSAYLFAINFLHIQENHWGGFEATSRYKIFGDLLKAALRKKIISKDDFWKDEKLIIKKLKNANNEEINKVMKILQHKSLKFLPKFRERAFKKFRYVDPYFLFSDKLTRLSEVNKKFKQELNEAEKKNRQGIQIPII